MPKKALICTALVGFIEGFLVDDIRILQSLGYEVHCAANDNNSGLIKSTEFLKEVGAVFHRISFSSRSPFSRESAEAYKQLKKLLAEEQFNIVHTHTPIAGAICRFACRKYRERGMKVIYTTHGFSFHKYSNKKEWLTYRTIETAMSRYCDAIITMNSEDFDYAEKMHCGKVYSIPGVGVDTQKFRDIIIDRSEYRRSLGLAEDDLVILSVGEVIKRKNQKIIVDALALAGIKAVFAVAGRELRDSACALDLRTAAEEKGIDLRMLGFRTDVAQIVKCADIGVLPSIREGLCISGIEMLASGLPLMGADVKGVRDYIIPDVNGYLANPFKPEEFAEGLKKLADRGNRKRLAANCFDSVRKYDAEKAHESMRKIYEEIAGA